MRGVLLARVEGVPLSAEEHLHPGGEVHRDVLRRYPDVAEVPDAVPRRDVHGSAEGYGEMGEVPADADARAKLIELGESFIAETVFLHPSKLDLVDTVQTAGYSVVLRAVRIPEELAVLRVRHSVEAGGHDVPEDKIRPCYRRLWDLGAAARADSWTFYDNGAVRGPRIVAQLSAVSSSLPHLADLDARRADRAVARRHFSRLAGGTLAGQQLTHPPRSGPRRQAFAGPMVLPALAFRVRRAGHSRCRLTPLFGVWCGSGGPGCPPFARGQPPCSPSPEQ